MALDFDESVEAYIGTPKSVDYYKDAFAKFDIEGGLEQWKWHWAWWAFFGGVFYLLYRKLYLEAAIFFVALLIVGKIPFLGIVFWIASGGVLPYFVYKRYMKVTQEVQDNIVNERAQLEAIRELGGVNKAIIWVAVVLNVALVIGFIYLVERLMTVGPLIKF